ncbi:MAG: Rieske 2Fe-2S domain-containing protein [Candidatus Bathyarchaeia archaeon]
MATNESDSSSWLEVAKVDEIPPSTMKHVEVDNREILVANIDGRFYAVND